MRFKNLFTKRTIEDNPYDTLTWIQKMAAMNLMLIFGSSCSGASIEIQKINHIMSVEGSKMGVSGNEMHNATSLFSGMQGMIGTLIGANRVALENLFWACYCIVAVGKSEGAAQVLFTVYNKFGFSEEECIYLLERRTGIKCNEL